MGDRHETVNRHSGIIRCACFLSFDWSSRWNDVLLKHPLPLPKEEPRVCCIAHLREQFYDQPAFAGPLFFLTESVKTPAAYGRLSKTDMPIRPGGCILCLGGDER